MRNQCFFRVGIFLLLGTGLAGTCAAPCLASQDTVVPQTALSVCRALTVTSRQDVTPGTSLAVSADGRYLVKLVHTTEGAELRLRLRGSDKERLIKLARPTLPPGITWRVNEMEFSPGGDLLVVRSVGKLWALATDTGQVLYHIGLDDKTQTYPGQFSLAGRHLAVSFWSAESYLADGPAKKLIEVRFYDATSGQVLNHLALPLSSSNQWTRLRLSPDGERLAVLLRARRWPSSARLDLFAADTGKRLWERKVGAEDLAWSADGRALLAVGDQLLWLSPQNGKKTREAEGRIRFSEFQQLRASEPANLAASRFERYNPLRRALEPSTQRQERWVLWRLDTGKVLCEVTLDRATTVDPWLTSTGEVISLEETYEVRPPLRLLRSARIVTYRVAKP